MASSPDVATAREPAAGWTLADWLDYQQGLHTRGIDLGLVRVRAVAERMQVLQPAPLVISVAGTNGKGSTVAFLAAMLRAAGKRTGCYTSPHIERYNERIRIDGENASDADLIAAFARIEAARGEISLTYFEFGTLAALWLFAQARLDVAVLEVGLGGRLDAVNIVDADAAIVTTIGLDHQDYLGDDLSGIAREKAGIFRAGRIAIVAQAEPLPALTEAAVTRGAQLWRCGHEYRFDAAGQGWYWHSGDTGIALPAPSLDAPCQCANAAGAIAALFALRERLGWQPAAILQGVRQAHVAARLQRFAGAPQLIVDVAHNPQAALVLADWLRAHPHPGRTLAVFSALIDKDVAAIAQTLLTGIDAWFVAGITDAGARGTDAAQVLARMRDGAKIDDAGLADDPYAALQLAWHEALPGDRVLAFGSFHVAAAALRFARDRALVAATTNAT